MLLREDRFDFCKGSPRQSNRLIDMKSIGAKLNFSISILTGAQSIDDRIRHHSGLKVSGSERADARGSLDVAKANETGSGAYEKVIREKGPQNEDLFARMGDQALIAGAIDFELRPSKISLREKFTIGFAPHTNPLQLRKVTVSVIDQIIISIK